MTQIYIWCFLALLVVLFLKDALLFPYWLEAQFKLHYVNLQMFWGTWTMHRKLKREFAALGWPVPPFRFVPIWDRKDYQ